MKASIHQRIDCLKGWLGYARKHYKNAQLKPEREEKEEHSKNRRYETRY